MMRNRKSGYGKCTDGLQHACPVEVTLDVIGGKWKGVIIYHLLNDTRRFNEFRRLVPGISQRMLTLQLRELENDGIIHREVYNVIPPKVEYSLTQFGQTLSNIIIQMREWGEIYAEQVQTRKTKTSI